MQQVSVLLELFFRCFSSQSEFDFEILFFFIGRQITQFAQGFTDFLGSFFVDFPDGAVLLPYITQGVFAACMLEMGQDQVANGAPAVLAGLVL